LEALQLHFQAMQEKDFSARDKCIHKAKEHVASMMKLVGERSFHVHSTRQQFKRYTDWWFAGDAELKNLVGEILGAFPEERSQLPDEAHMEEAYVR
jgi:hypothetical protein